MSLSAGRIQAAIAESYDGAVEVEVFESLGSTNEHLRTILANEPTAEDASPRACVARHQTAGVGRRGKVWLSPPDSITVSVAKNFGCPAMGLAGLSLVTGIAVVSLLERLGVTGLSLKWPNDVLLSGQKLAGILIEIPRVSGSSSQTITGIGLNVAEGEVLSGVDQPYATLASAGADLAEGMPDRETLTGLLVGTVLTHYAEFDRQGWTPFMSRWQRLDHLAGQPVTLIPGGADQKPSFGVARGVSSEGGLIIESAGRLSTVYSGEVSVRTA